MVTERAQKNPLVPAEAGDPVLAGFPLCARMNGVCRWQPPPLERRGGSDHPTSARARFEACSAREVIADTASSLLRPASAIAVDAVAKDLAACCLFWPNSLV